MGGGEIARHLGTYGSDRVRRAAIIAGIPPYLLKTADTPQGVPQEPFDQIAGALTADRFAYFTERNKAFFNLDQPLGGVIAERRRLAVDLTVPWSAGYGYAVDPGRWCSSGWMAGLLAMGPGTCRVAGPDRNRRGLR